MLLFFFQTLGGIIDGKAGVVKPTPTRAWNIILAFESLLDSPVDWVVLRQLLGHAMTICTLNRLGMSVFRALYDFVEAAPKPRMLNGKERQEVLNFVGLVPLLVGELRRPWSTTITCTDASPQGFGVCQRSLDKDQVHNLGMWQDRWRFRHLDPSEWQPRMRSQGLDPLRDHGTACAVAREETVDDLYSYNNYFPEVSADVTEPQHWRTKMMGKWGNSSEHITQKEGRALVLAIKRLCRSSGNRGFRHLILVDSFALCMAMCKGRASNFKLLRVMQQVSALCLAGGFTVRTRWIASERNVADGPSRGQIIPGPYKTAGGQSADKAKEAEFDQSCASAASSLDQQAPSGSQGSKGSTQSVNEANASSGQELGEACYSEKFVQDHTGSRETGSEQQADCFGETIGFESNREPVCGILPEVLEFLPGARFGSSSKFPDRRDDHLAEFMDSMFLEGRGVNEGEKVLAAVEFHHCVLKGRMARSRKALRGWRKEVPPQSRIPIPMIIAYGLAMVLLSRKKFNMALKAILDFDTYMRPGESLDLRKRNIVAPVKKAGPQYKWFSIVVRDFDNKKPDKVGVFDNSIPLDSKKRMWIGPILHQLANKCPNKDDQIFDFNMDEFRKEFTAAGSLLGINNLHPYQLRHGGAAEDLNSRSRDHQGVKFRGRWNTDVSVRRYTKVGKVQQLMNLLSPKSMAYCHWSVRNLEKVFQGLTPPKHL